LLERGHDHHQFGAVHRRARGARIEGIQFDFRVQQQVSPARLDEHLRGVQAEGSRPNGSAPAR